MLPLTLGLCLAIISIFGLLINAYILLVIVLSKQVSANNILLLHLGIVDSILCLLFLVFSLPSIARNDGTAIFEIACSLHGFLLTLMHPMVLWTICCLNCDRYYAIAAPLHYSAIVNTKRVFTALISGWFVTIGLCIPPFFNIAPYQYNKELGACSPHFEQIGSLWYAIVFTTITFIVPAIIIIGCNIRVLMIARYHRHRIAAAIYEVTLSAQVTITHQRNPFMIPLTGPKFRSRSPVSSVLQLIGSFLILYCPYYITILWNSSVASLYSGNIPKSLQFANHIIALTAVILLTCSPSINGLLYGIKSKTMRKTFQNYWRKKKTKSEITQEIQARTPSTCGSRRPSLATLGIFNRPMPQRRLSETIIDIDRYPENKPTMKRVSSEISWRTGSKTTFVDDTQQRRLPQTSSCNTLQIPYTDRDFHGLTDADKELYANLKLSLKSALKTGNNGQSGGTTVVVPTTDTTSTYHSKSSIGGLSSTTTNLLHKVLRIEINNDHHHQKQDQSDHETALYSNGCIKSPRILITRAYSEDNDAGIIARSVIIENHHALSKLRNGESLENNAQINSNNNNNSVNSENYYKIIPKSIQKYSSLDDSGSQCNDYAYESEPNEEQVLLSWPITKRKYATSSSASVHRAYCSSRNYQPVVRPNPVYSDRCEKPDVVL